MLWALSYASKGHSLLLSETDVTNKWRSLFGAGRVTSETIESARVLIDQLPPESPLRVRLGNELDEIRAHMASPSPTRSRRIGRR